MKLRYEAGLLRNVHEDAPGILGVGTVHDQTAFIITPSWQPPADSAGTPSRAFVYGGEDARQHLDGQRQYLRRINANGHATITKGDAADLITTHVATKRLARLDRATAALASQPR